MASCRQAIKHYQSLCWPWSILPYGRVWRYVISRIIVSQILLWNVNIYQGHNLLSYQISATSCIPLDFQQPFLFSFKQGNQPIVTKLRGDMEIQDFAVTLTSSFPLLPPLEDVQDNLDQEVSVNEHDDVIEWKHFPCYWPFVTGEFPSQRPVPRSFNAFFDLCLNKRLSKQSRRRWFEMQSCSLWRHCNDLLESRW